MKQSRILIVRAGALGDTLMVTPLIRALHQRNTDAEIDMLCSPAGAELLASNPRLSRRLVLRQRNWPYFLSPEKWRLVKELRSRQYDSAILLETAPRYRELLRRARIANVRDFQSAPFDPESHSIVSNLRVGGFENVSHLDMELPCSAISNDLPRPIVVIHPGYGPANKKHDQSSRLRGWSAEKFARVAQEMVSRGACVVLTGSREDVELCEFITRDLPQERFRILAGRTGVAQFVGAIKASDLLISVDSAAAHIAAAVGTPALVLWGPGILAQTRPVSSTTQITIIRKFVPCAPCYGTPLMKSCQRNVCMEQIGTDEVIQHAMSVLTWLKIGVT